MGGVSHEALLEPESWCGTQLGEATVLAKKLREKRQILGKKSQKWRYLFPPIKNSKICHFAFLPMTNHEIAEKSRA